MRYDPDRKHRHSLRRKDHDYARPGAYFVTCCLHQRECLLGEIQNDALLLSAAGEAVAQVWQTVSARFPHVRLDTFQVMPNHLHALVCIDPPVSGAPPPAATLGAIVGALKSLSAIAANRLLDRVGQPFWQRNYYERIVRTPAEMALTRRYILDNPAGWNTDVEHPDAPPSLSSCPAVPPSLP